LNSKITKRYAAFDVQAGAANQQNYSVPSPGGGGGGGGGMGNGGSILPFSSQQACGCCRSLAMFSGVHENNAIFKSPTHSARVIFFITNCFN
jgi:hypothetical protein